MRYRSQTLGLSLIEVMISMAIGSIVILGVLNLFTANSETYNALQAQARLQESANYGLNVIGRDLQKAGYRGCYRSGDLYLTMTNVPSRFDLRTPLSVFNGVTGDDWSTSATSLASSVSDVATRGSDILSIRYLADDESYLSSALSDDTQAFEVIVVSGASSSLASGDIALLHDCEKATLFSVTNDPVPSGARLRLEHAVDASNSQANQVAGLAETGAFGTDAAVSSIVENTYYVSQGASGLSGAGGLSLYRFDGSNSVELVEGVENMQIKLGIDSDSDGVPNQYVDPSSGVDTTNVVAVWVALTSNSVAAVGTSETDGLLRRTYRQTIQLRNAR